LFEVVQAFLSIDFGYAWLLVMMIIAAILTILFFLLVFRKNSSFANAHKTVSKSTESRQKSDSGPTKMHSPFRGVARHKCAICGRTEKTNPELEFRYCSKCVGNYEYCMDHLYTHLHKYPNVTDNVSK
ncbi:MAG: hypothetical protein IKY02_02805, partial [Lachnospiraceae bacterium]|nr:hypothetical protein [Lachnospiraceae bacterium]